MTHPQYAVAYRESLFPLSPLTVGNLCSCNSVLTYAPIQDPRLHNILQPCWHIVTPSYQLNLP